MTPTPRGPILLRETACTGCRRCAGVCPVGAVSHPRGKARIDGALCVRCGRCVAVCPMRALTLSDTAD